MNMEEKTVNYQQTIVEARPYQIATEDAMKLRVIDLFQDEDAQGYRLLSRADLILIFTLYANGMEEFLEDYKKHIQMLRDERGYKFVPKPHHYLKGIIG